MLCNSRHLRYDRRTLDGKAEEDTKVPMMTEVVGQPCNTGTDVHIPMVGRESITPWEL